MPKFLRDVVLDEVSLVDKGANPGARVTLFKRKMPPDNMDDEEMEMDAKDVQKQIDEAVAKAAGDVQKRIDEAVAKAKADADTKIAKAEADAKAAVEKAEKTAAEAVAKANEKIAKAETEKRLAELVTKSQAFKHIPGKPEDLAKVFQKLDGTDEFKTLETVLTAANEAAAKVATEIGKGGGGGGANTAYDQLVAKAVEIRKNDTKITQERAFTMACDQNKDLYKQYQSERRVQH